tara:strand:- start:25 stop:444 length:420 start_codon:yes stop_codon:yes gene_type:complete
MRNSEVKFLRIKMSQASHASNGRIYHVPLEAITSVVKSPAANDSTPATLVINYTSGGSNNVITATTSDVGTKAQLDEAIGAFETELLNAIDIANNGSKNVVRVPWSEGNMFESLIDASKLPAGMLGTESDNTKTKISHS